MRVGVFAIYTDWDQVSDAIKAVEVMGVEKDLKLLALGTRW